MRSQPTWGSRYIVNITSCLQHPLRTSMLPYFPSMIWGGFGDLYFRPSNASVKSLSKKHRLGAWFSPAVSDYVTVIFFFAFESVIWTSLFNKVGFESKLCTLSKIRIQPYNPISVNKIPVLWRAWRLLPAFQPRFDSVCRFLSRTRVEFK